MKDIKDKKLIKVFREVKKSQYSERTLKNYCYNLLEFERGLKELGRPLSELTVEDLGNFIEEAKERGLATRTILVKLWSIKTFAKWLYYKDILLEKEHKAIEEYWPNLPKNEDNRRALSKTEENKILKKLTNPIFRMLFWVGVNYGLRCSEFANLRVMDVNLKKKIITIHYAKGNKTRRIPIHNHHVKEWENYLRYRSGYELDHEYVFFTSRGHATIRSIQRYFNQMSVKVYAFPKGLSKEEKNQFRQDRWFTAHILRFTYATNLYQGGVDILWISKMLGHNSISTTQKYLRIEEHEAHKSYLEQSKEVLT